MILRSKSSTERGARLVRFGFSREGVGIVPCERSKSPLSVPFNVPYHLLAAANPW